jgi:hypothetical protein
MYPVANSDNPDITNTTTQWIRRIPFYCQKHRLIKRLLKELFHYFGGPDKVTTPLWWDKN